MFVTHLFFVAAMLCCILRNAVCLFQLLAFGRLSAFSEAHWQIPENW